MLRVLPLGRGGGRDVEGCAEGAVSSYRTVRVLLSRGARGSEVGGGTGGRSDWGGGPWGGGGYRVGEPLSERVEERVREAFPGV